MSRRLTYAIAAAATAIALTLSGCAASPDTKADSAASGSFPVTIKHAFGETTIEEEPTRVATWGVGSEDDAIALGVVPVAVPQQWGADKGEVLPWVAEALKKSGDKTPTVLPESAEPPYEAIAKAEPDVILAGYSGITKKQYNLLSEIAPVVAFPKAAWTTGWKELIEITGTALGRSEQADKLLGDIDAELAAQATAHPEFKGKSISLVADVPDKTWVYKKEDPRVDYVLDLGFKDAKSVDALAAGKSTFSYELSHEQLDKLSSDVLVNFSPTMEGSDEFLSAGYAQVMPQVKNKAVASLHGEEFIASVSPPTGLSLTWGLDDYVAQLSEAAKAADAAAGK